MPFARLLVSREVAYFNAALAGYTPAIPPPPTEYRAAVGTTLPEQLPHARGADNAAGVGVGERHVELVVLADPALRAGFLAAATLP